jgi:hypothetical protein
LDEQNKKVSVTMDGANRKIFKAIPFNFTWTNEKKRISDFTRGFLLERASENAKSRGESR